MLNKLLKIFGLFIISLSCLINCQSGGGHPLKSESPSTQPNTFSQPGSSMPSKGGTSVNENRFVATGSEENPPVITEQEKNKTIKQQENDFLAQQYYETALKLYKEFNYQQALDNVQKSLQYNPHNLAAEKLLIDLRRLVLGSRADEIKSVVEDAQKRLTIKLQQLEVEVRHHFFKAEQYMKEEKFKDAIKEYEAIEEKLKWDPYGFQSIATYRQQSKERLKTAQDRLKTQDEKVALEQRRAAEELVRVEDERRKVEFNQQVKQIFEQAVINFEQRRYKESEKLADKILALLPNFKPAQNLKNDCLFAQHKKVQEEYIKLKVQGWKLFQESFDEELIPYSRDQIIRYDKETWGKALRREPTGLTDKKMTEDPDVLVIKRIMETVRENIIVNEEHSLQEQLDFISQRYNIPITYGDGVSDAITAAGAKKFSLTNLPLGTALKYALQQYSVSGGTQLYYIFRDKAICIVTQAEAQPSRELKIYNVDDLVYQVPNFEPPSTALDLNLPGPTGAQFPPPQPVTLPQKTALTLEGLIELIKKNVASDTWEGATPASANAVPGTQITPVGTNKIMVIQLAQNQKEVVEFLKMLRSFQGTMISIQANFLNVTDDFLEDIGVQWQGLQQTRNQTGTLTATQNLAGGGGQPGFEKIGNSAGTPYDLRFRSDYTFNSGNLIQGVAQTDPSAALGGRLVDAGGLGLQYTFLGRNPLNLVAKAIQKKEKVILLDSPKIMALNAQRSYVTFLKEVSFIRDLDIISGALAYDPILDTLQLGIILDVMPVMSYDRKFITLHTLPTFIQLQGVRDMTFAPSGTGWNGETGTVYGENYTLQLPWVRTHRARTTVQCPDKGTILLGGMKTASDIDLEMRTPVLEKLPLVGSLFRRRAKTLEKQNLLIMMTAEIVDLPDMEKEIE